MSSHHETSEPLGGPLMTRPFLVLCAIFALGLVLTLWREVVGLGPASGMNDGFTWGLWKNFNIIVLTSFGSGGYATGLLFYVFGRRKFLPVARVALLVSLLAYTTGIIALLVDLGRPWNFWRVIFVWDWNLHSILLEVALCMSTYLAFLYIENMHPVLEVAAKSTNPGWRNIGHKWLPVLEKVSPYVIAACIVLPSMHQSSLGGLMMLAGPRVHPLWQSYLVPLYSVLTALFAGWAGVVVFYLLSALVWKRSYEMPAISLLSRYMAWFALGWCGIRVVDLLVSGKLGNLFHFDLYSAVFILEMALILVGAFMTLGEAASKRPKTAFTAASLVGLGAMLWRYNITTIGFMPGVQWRYFPSVVEILICAAYMALGVIAYIVIVKRLPIMPIAPARARH